MTAQLPALAAVMAALGLLLSAAPTSSATPLSVIDDRGHTITLIAPAQRIVSLAPHATELLFAAGAGEKLVGVSEYSDFPADAKDLPSVGGSGQIDLERIVNLKPDLVVAWSSGNRARQVNRLRQLGFTVFESEPRSFDMVASSLERLGILAGSAAGTIRAQQFRQHFIQLQQQYARRVPVTVFYQIWSAPLMTLNDNHIVSQAIRLCGGVNVFGHLKPLAPVVSREAIVQANPAMIIVSDQESDALQRWRSFKHLNAVVQDNLYAVNGRILNRAGPRLLDATAELCQTIDQARNKSGKP